LNNDNNSYEIIKNLESENIKLKKDITYIKEKTKYATLNTRKSLTTLKLSITKI